MQWPYLYRARMHRSGTGARIKRWCLALAAAATLSILAIIAGLLIHTLMARDARIAAAAAAVGDATAADTAPADAAPADAAPADAAPADAAPSDATPSEATPSEATAGIGPSDQESPQRAPQGWLLAQAWTRLGARPLSSASLAHAAGLMVLLTAFLWLFIGRAAEHEAQHVVDRLRKAIREQAFNDSGNDLLGAPTRPEELLLDHCESLRSGLAALWQTAPRAILGVSALLAAAALTDPWITLLGLLLWGLLWWAWRKLEDAAEQRANSLHGSAAQSESLLLESLRLAPLTASFSLAEAPGRKFEKILSDHGTAELQSHLVRASLGSQRLTLIAIGAWALLLVFALTDRLSLADGALFAVAVLGAQLLVRQTLNAVSILERADGAAGAIFDYLKQQPPLAESKSPREVERLSQSLKLDGVTLEDRHGHRVLDGATCVLPAQCRIALISSDSRAPAAMAGLCARLYDPVEGFVTYDGVDLRGLNLKQLRGQTAVVTADAMLFTASVAENISCGSPYTPAEIQTAAAMAGADEIISGLPERYDTIVGPLGAELQPEIQFRIGLARALIRNPSLLIVEEPAQLARRHADGNASNASNSSSSIESVMRVISQSRTTVVIPSRPEVLRNADLVLVLHQGKILASGSHNELLQTCELYRHLNYIQFNPYRNHAP